jgi:D-3-phosphoglycerate dehydrogenase
MNVAILDDYQDMVRGFSCLKKLAGHHVTIWNDHTSNVDILAQRLKDVEALVLLRERTPIPGALIDRLDKLKLITQNGPYPHIDVAACSRRGVLICAGHARTSYATAELTWGLIICAMRHIPQEIARLKSGGWQRTLGTGLRGRTLGLFGYGKIGTQVAGYGKAFGMRVLVWSRERGRTAALADGYAAASSKQNLFEESDVLSMHIRLTPETQNIVSAQDLASMKPASVFVNTSRDGLVKKEALANALRAGRPGRAAVDVYGEEPLAADYPLLALDNAICTPHLGYTEHDQMESYFDAQFERILAFERGETEDVVNPEARQL